MKIEVKLNNEGLRKPFISQIKRDRGITLIALIISIIILIILAAISIKMITDGGILEVTDKGVSTYLAESQRERLVYALEAARIERERNKEFDKNADVDRIIKNDIPEAEIGKNIVAIGGVEFYIDRDKLDIITIKNRGEDIPIYTAEQLQKVGMGEVVSINGINYVFDKNSTYILQNDIEYIGDYTEVAKAIKNKEITFLGQGNKIIVTNANGKEEYYTEDSKYYIAVNKYGYVLNGLELYYDGIDNVGTGTHSSNSGTWKDLSGNNKDGTLTNIDTTSCWKADGLTFDGTDDYVKIGEMNYPNVTLEVVAETSDMSRNSQCALCNAEVGGYEIVIKPNKIRTNMYISGKRI